MHYYKKHPFKWYQFNIIQTIKKKKKKKLPESQSDLKNFFRKFQMSFYNNISKMLL